MITFVSLKGFKYYIEVVYGFLTITLLVMVVSYDSVRIEREISLTQDILPAWNKACGHCHGGEDAFFPRLDKDYIMKSLSNPYLVEPNNADSSYIVSFLKTHPDTLLTLRQQIYLRNWIDQGAKNF